MAESVADMVKSVLKIEKAKLTEEDKTKGVTSIADIKMDQVVEIAKKKIEDMNVKSFKSAVKQVIGSISSMQGITIEGKKAKEILKEIDEGKWDNLING